MPGKPEDERKPRSYSIRLAASLSWDCAACGEPVAGGGPAGHRDGRPVCDRCLLEASPQLGMVMALVAVTRAYGAMSVRMPGDWIAALRQLGIFARVYECVAARYGPRRTFRLEGEAPEAGAAVSNDREEHDGDR